MLLRHEIDIDCSAEALFNWLGAIDQHYLQWHPDHISCRYINGDSFEPGSILFCQEYLHGRPHKFRMRLTRHEPGERVEYSVGLGMKGVFAAEPDGDGVRFIAELQLGFRLPLIARAQDAALRRLIGWKIEALEKHMREEGENLKAIIEAEDEEPENGEAEMEPSVEAAESG